MMKLTHIKIRGPSLLAWGLVILALITMMSGVAEIPDIIRADHLPTNIWAQIFDVITRTVIFKYSAALVASGTTILAFWGVISGVSFVFHFFVSSPDRIVDAIWVIAAVAGLLSIIAAILIDFRNLQNLPKNPIFQVGGALVTACMSFAFGGQINRKRHIREVADLKRRVDELNEKLHESRTKVFGLYVLMTRMGGSSSIPPELKP